MGYSPFARHYLGNHCCCLLLFLLRCFSSEGSPRTEYGIPVETRMGFPIRTSADHSFVAAPRSLSQLSTSFIATACQGIHRVPLLTLTCMACTNPHPSSYHVKQQADRSTTHQAPSGLLDLPQSFITAYYHYVKEPTP